MLKQKKEINKTQRILSVYHLLKHCDEVSAKELSDQLPGSKKTFSRDIGLLKKAGVQVRYSAQRQAYVLTGWETAARDLPDGKGELRYIEKIIRLITIMDDLPEEDCDKWYEATFPDISRRTMQRDFAVLNELGFRIKYEREALNLHDAGRDVPPNHYYCDRPESAYSLETFRRSE